jgi:hypothetical protein
VFVCLCVYLPACFISKTDKHISMKCGVLVRHYICKMNLIMLRVVPYFTLLSDRTKIDKMAHRAKDCYITENETVVAKSL